jgi:hypothetical protein
MCRGCIRKDYIERHWFGRIPLVFKLLLPLILPVFTELFNYILTSSTFLLVWKISSVVPIPKVHSPTEKSDYRPISILPVHNIYKSLCNFENVMYEQIVYYVGRNDLISSFQSGFRPGHSTATAIARVSDDIRLNMESNQPTILILLDFSKAFDIVCHELFILKLRQRSALRLSCYGGGTRLFLSFSSVSKSCKWGRCFSFSPISGWCSSEISYINILFFLFIDFMTEVLKFSKYHLYADDLQIYHSRPREMLFECIREVNSDLSKVFEWSLANSLKLNPSKSMVLATIQKSLIRFCSAAFSW